jgi:hypothetical protein
MAKNWRNERYWGEFVINRAIEILYIIKVMMMMIFFFPLKWWHFSLKEGDGGLNIIERRVMGLLHWNNIMANFLKWKVVNDLWTNNKMVILWITKVMANFQPKKQWRFKHQWMESGKVLMKFFKWNVMGDFPTNRTMTIF